MKLPRPRPLALLAAMAFGATLLLQAQTPRLSNISARAQVGNAGSLMITGIVVGPGSTETVLIRAVGPTLAADGVGGALSSPVLSLFAADGSLIGSNQGWGSGASGAGISSATAAIMASAGAFALPAGSQDSALVATLAPGSYSAEVAGAGGATGVSLLEVYEVNPGAGTGRLVNLSTRAQVGTGANVLLCGFTVSPGSGARTLLIRASGPALAALGIANSLADPALAVLNNASGATIASNDNWGTPVNGGATAAALAAASTQAGAFAFANGSLDAAVLSAFTPGSYTIQVAGNNGSTGLSLVEIYDVTPTGTSGPDTVSIAATAPNADTSGSNPGAFTVTRSGDASQPLSVTYNVAGSAINGIGYPALPGSVTIPAGSSSATIAIAPNPTLNAAQSSTVILTLTTAGSYTVGSPATATVTIASIPPTLYVANLRPTPNAVNSTAAGVATILLNSNGTVASVNVSFGNLSSDEVVAHLAIGGDMNNGTYVLNLPNGEIGNFGWQLGPVAQYSAAQIVAALKSGNLFVEIDSANYPGGELGGQFIQATGSQAFSAPASPPPLDLSKVTASDGPRFLTQATFGPTAADLAALTSQGYVQWIANQMALPATSQRRATDADAALFPNQGGQYPVTQNNRQAGWWKIAVTAPDQLRQRVAFALSEILVVSDQASSLANQPDGLANYYDILAQDAFGNFRQMIQDVTLSPTMGNYLNMLRNNKANPAAGISADENYAREIMQLFTIGLNQLQPDGTLVLDQNGLPIPTYDQATIVQTANVFTGWGYYSTAANPSFNGATADFEHPMMLYPANHDTTQKTIVGGVVIPAGQTGMADLKIELDTLFNHPNTGPFISQLLIQRLVTSNPSPGYVYRVAQVFANDGTGARGNLGAVVKAILLDYEARSPAVLGDAGFGKLKEPLLRQTAIYRAFNATAPNGRFAIFNAQTSFSQAPLRSPTVFNFFSPSYVPPGVLASAGLVGPEFQIDTASTAISVPNGLYGSIYQGSGGLNLDLSSLTANAANPSAMVATLNQLLAQGNMSAAAQQRIVAALMAMPTGTSAAAAAQAALYLVSTTNEAAVQK